MGAHRAVWARAPHGCPPPPLLKASAIMPASKLKDCLDGIGGHITGGVQAMRSRRREARHDLRCRAGQAKLAESTIRRITSSLGAPLQFAEAATQTATTTGPAPEEGDWPALRLAFHFCSFAAHPARHIFGLMSCLGPLSGGVPWGGC